MIGILLQLINRNKTKLGSRLDLSMLDCQVAILENAISRYSVEKTIPEPLGTDHPSITPFGAFKTLNGLIVIAIGNDKMFSRFCQIIGSEKLAKNKLFVDNNLRNKNLSVLRKKIENVLKKKKKEFWIKRFQKNHIPCSKINTIKDLFNNKQIKDRRMILDYNDDIVKTFKVSGNPIKLSCLQSNQKNLKAPDLDENREYILKHFKLI